MKKIVSGFLLLLSASVYAATYIWQDTTTHYAIYFDGGYATMPFLGPSSVPSYGTSITNVEYAWSPYDNGNTNEFVQICYSEPYSSAIEYCNDISGSQTGNIQAYDGFNAKGTFWIRHTLTGGAYPVYSTATDTVTVTYDY